MYLPTFLVTTTTPINRRHAVYLVLLRRWSQPRFLFSGELFPVKSTAIWSSVREMPLLAADRVRRCQNHPCPKALLLGWALPRPFAQLLPGLETGHPVTVGQSPAHESHTEQSETETRKTPFCSSETLKSYAGD